jgi:hypothetical protein
MWAEQEEDRYDGRSEAEKGRKERFIMSSCSLSRSPHPSFSSTSIPTYFVLPFQLGFLSAILLNDAKYSFFFVFLPVLAPVFFPPISLDFEIDAMLPNELLPPSLSSIMNF